MKTIQLSDAAYAELRAAFDLPREPFSELDPRITKDNIITAVCKKMWVSQETLMSKSQSPRVCEARFMVWRLLWEFMSLNQVEIGAMFCKNHSTISNGCKKLQNRLDTDPKLNLSFEQVRNSLNPPPTASPDAIAATLIAKEGQDSGQRAGG